jgi:glycosyltransferase involved in cell wall biosynthesis
MKTVSYKPRSERKKILLICDDIRSNSGVANVAKDIVMQTSEHYNWACIAGSIKHPDKGKRLDISNAFEKELGIKDIYCMIYPVDGYGDPQLVRQIIDIEQPDGLMIITDPRYFEWLFHMERELRKDMPIIYLNIWDDLPAPQYNEAFYESCDALLAISKQTKLINETVLGSKAKDKIIEYIPHGINDEVFYPKNDSDGDYKDYLKFKNTLLDKDYDFTMLFNSRNMRRKQLPDAMTAFRIFLDKLDKKDADKCTFIVHTELVSEHGTDLIALSEYLFGGKYDNAIKFTNQRLGTLQMHWLYNIADVQIQLSSNEGWGLALTEAIMCGTPFIATVTGGMQDQMGFLDKNGKWFTPTVDLPSNHYGTLRQHGEWCYPVYPTSVSLQGSPKTPYIFDDRIDIRDAVTAIETAYNDRNKLKEKGLKGREWAKSKKIGFTASIMSKRIIQAIDKTFDEFQPRSNYEVYNSTEFEPQRLKHKLIY